MCACLFNASTCLLAVSPTSTSPWWALCLLYAVTSTAACINALVEWIFGFGVPVTLTEAPNHFVIMVRLLSLPRHRACHDNRLPPSVKRHGGADASAVEGGLGSLPLFYILAIGAPRPQECASGECWSFIH